MVYTDKTKEDLAAILANEQKNYAAFKKQKLALDMTRGKPEKAQLDIALPMLKMLGDDNFDFKTAGIDARNYGGLDGIPEMREIFAELFDVSPDEVIAGDGSSLAIMYKLVQHGKQFGFLGATPWNKLAKVKFICPTPGYDRHFNICKHFGIEMISVPTDENGPDMAVVEALAADESVKGMWCVPKYSNPTGIIYSDKVVERIASMKAAADFRVFWDNAYIVHALYGEDKLKNIFDCCKKAGNPNRVFAFTSTSKITFAGAGVAALASSKENLAEYKSRIMFETIGPNKINQLIHARFLKNKDCVKSIMEKHADILRPKFELVVKMLEELAADGLCTFTRPRGGYFVSLNVVPGCAKRVVQFAAEAGVKLTEAGATYPLGLDDKDANIRLAPSVPPISELETAMKVLINCVRIAVLEKLAA
ncbi:MAG TPA: aminotransferase class I/II-fold pyridoxal phosphate-dependent enzyme [Clostridia bacterium]|nr:aminotransferase class I/II-fold pyridoxal phosphate-dependent enzyme [Clostridia bacterium]HRU84988.1 aminotransferase class I/II-fold pyridoxal phosphate-dependent enzyme [Eubacteriales bacterium]